jgi:phosphoribosylamine--glycine ligase
MAKILFLSNEGLAYVLGWKMTEEGHDIRFYTKQKEDKRGGDGFVKKVKIWQDSVEWADLIMTDDCGWGKILEKIRSSGKPCIGGTILSDALEEDRSAGQKMFQALGMDILPSYDFKTIPEAIGHIEKNPTGWVVKVSGKSQADKSLTYVSQMEDGSDVPGVLEHMAKKSGLAVGSVHLQEKIDGIEAAVGGYFNGQEFMNPVCVNFEHKKLMPSRTHQAGIGPSTGEMGTANFWRDRGFRLYNETIGRFAPLLKREGYRGYFDINCIVHINLEEAPEKGWHVHPLETTCRFGWPLLAMHLETMQINNLGELFFDMANSKISDFSVSYPCSLCVVVGCPPLPYKDASLADDYSTDMPIHFRNKEDLEGIYPGDAYLEEGVWRITGTMGYPVVCAGSGDSLQEAQMRAYERVRNVVIPNAMYREDIGDLIPDQMNCLKEFLSYDSQNVKEEA